MSIVFVIAAALVLNILGAVICKYIAINITIIHIALALCAFLAVVYTARVVFWILVGRKYQLSYIYPVLSINYFFSFLLGMSLFGEQFQLSRLVGALIIVSGVLVISLSAHRYEGGGI